MIETIFTLWATLARTPHISTYAAQRAPHVFAMDAVALSRTRGFPRASTVEVPLAAIMKDPPVHTARAVLVVDEHYERVIYEESADTVMPLASITKLASALTALRMGLDLKKTIVITSDDVIEQPSALALGDVIESKDLLALALIGSSNTAAHTLARATGLSSEEFVKQMNITAQELGLTDAFFVEPTGLNPGNVGTARDVYRLLVVAQNEETLKELLGKSEHYFSNGKTRKKIYSTNIFKLGILPFAEDTIIAAKTGYIPETGFHFAMTAKDNDGSVRQVIILGAADHFARFTEAESFLTWARNKTYDAVE